ncbi:outer membrane protein slp precursor [bacterium BMS3Bbin05]|nr:outer membrane protein slp precursor [bacterium BMS3Bbin05]
MMYSMFVKPRMLHVFFILILSYSLISCAHVVSEEMRAKADTGLSPEKIFKNPDSFAGKTVIMGGVIISAKNEASGTYIEVLQRPLDSRGRPERTDMSAGRFIAFRDGFLDSKIYSPGRQVTVAGEITGGMSGKVGEMPYRYPLVKIEEIHLYQPGRRIPFSFSIGIWHIF